MFSICICIYICLQRYIYVYVYDPEPELEPEQEPYSNKMSEPEQSSNFPVPQPWLPGQKLEHWTVTRTVQTRVAELEPELVRTVFIWGLWHRNRIWNTFPVPGTRKWSKKFTISLIISFPCRFRYNNRYRYRYRYGYRYRYRDKYRYRYRYENAYRYDYVYRMYIYVYVFVL
jgi:hypothetical protein